MYQGCSQGTEPNFCYSIQYVSHLVTESLESIVKRYYSWWRENNLQRRIEWIWQFEIASVIGSTILQLGQLGIIVDPIQLICSRTGVHGVHKVSFPSCAHMLTNSEVMRWEEVSGQTASWKQAVVIDAGNLGVNCHTFRSCRTTHLPPLTTETQQ